MRYSEFIEEQRNWNDAYRFDKKAETELSPGSHETQYTEQQ